MKFVENHFEIGEKYIEFVKFACQKSEMCTFCSYHDWAGPPCEAVPKPYTDHGANGFRYKSVFETPLQMDGKDREVDDFQQRKQARDYLKKGIRKLSGDENIKSFCTKFLVKEVILRKYLDHLNYLQWILIKERRKKKRGFKTNKTSTESLETTTGLSYSIMGLLKKLKVSDPDKYLNHYGLKKSLKLRKLEKIKLIQGHIISQQ